MNPIIVPVRVDTTAHRLLAVLGDQARPEAERVREVLERLADHAQQGVYRPGAWEREWICSAFGYGWIKLLLPGDPYGRPNCEKIFQKPRP